MAVVDRDETVHPGDRVDRGAPVIAATVVIVIVVGAPIVAIVVVEIREEETRLDLQYCMAVPKFDRSRNYRTLYLPRPPFFSPGSNRLLVKES